MLVNCNIHCKIDTTTTCALDKDEDIVVCTKCGEELLNMSKATKRILDINREYIQQSRPKAFMFKCQTCSKTVETISVESDNGKQICGMIKGAPCENGCKFELTKFAENAINTYKKYQVETEEK